MSVQIDGTAEEPARSVVAAFELTGNAERGRLDLITPIGVTLARASWQPGAVSVETPQGKSQHASLADMSRQVLGEALPVAAMFDWLRGRPWPGAGSVAAPPDEPVGFHQLGWAVDLSRFEQSRIAARRSEPPAVVVLLRLDTE
jgi:outer membrane lipoprotein LolB